MLHSAKTYDSDSVSHGVSGEIFAELGADTAVVAVQSDHFAPDGAQPGLCLGVLGNAAAVLGLEDVDTSFADVETSVLLPAAALDLQDHLVLVLVPQASLVAGEDSLGEETGRGSSSDSRLPSSRSGGHGR